MNQNRLWPARLGLAWIACALALGLLAWAGTLLAPRQPITEIFFRADIAVALVSGGFIAVLALVAWPFARMNIGIEHRPTAAVAAVLAAVLAGVGWYTVMHGYPLSMDEFMARFDAAIFRTGRLFATVPPEWSPLRLPLQAQFTLYAPDGSSWASSYLPVNAMVLAAFAQLGFPAGAGMLWILIACAAVWGLARRLWPERPDAAVVAVVLLATSTQALLAAMTPYAMAAHLALNLTWLWLFTREDRASQIGAVGVAFLACGLHQVVFHPLFAAPFVLQRLMQRRWGLVAFHTLAYLAIGVFWISYWRLFLPAGGGGAAGGGAMGLGVWLARLKDVADNFAVADLGVMAKNLFRFVTWQNPAAIGLALLAIWPAIRLGGLLRYAVMGLVLVLGVVTAIIPYQGHGWGYRYLHGYLGIVSLLAALGWIRLTEGFNRQRARAAAIGFTVLAAFSLVVLLPLRAHQAEAFIASYDEALAAVRSAEVDVVMVDPAGMLFAQDLVRNDPFLRNRPKVMDLLMLREDQIRAVCARHSVAVFDRASGASIRPVRLTQQNLHRLAENRRVLREIGCDSRRVAVRPSAPAKPS